MKNLLVALVVIAAAGCASAPDKGVLSQDGEIQTSWGEQGETSKYIFARGIGAANQALTNKTQRLALSRNAAIVNAQYNMLSVIAGLELAGGVNVQAALEKNSTLGTQIQSVIKGAQITRTEWASDDGCVVALRMSKSTLKAAGLRLAE